VAIHLAAEAILGPPRAATRWNRSGASPSASSTAPRGFLVDLERMGGTGQSLPADGRRCSRTSCAVAAPRIEYLNGYVSEQGASSIHRFNDKVVG
jgi:hypothetical protein